MKFSHIIESDSSVVGCPCHLVRWQYKCVFRTQGTRSSQTPSDYQTVTFEIRCQITNSFLDPKILQSITSIRNRLHLARSYCCALDELGARDVCCLLPHRG